MLSEIKIKGYRGFREEGSLNFAIPDNEKDGSGLTIVTGSNNSGKSTILECIKYFSKGYPPSFNAGLRHAEKDYVEINYFGIPTDGNPNPSKRIITIRQGSSETKIEGELNGNIPYCVSSRRSFSSYFQKRSYEREQYIINESNNIENRGIRLSTLPDFEARLFKINDNPITFNNLLRTALGYETNWTIDQSPQAQYYLKFIKEKANHSSEGVGEGIVSLFVILDALYDSKSGDIIAIDEPELSLHPSIQKRLSQIFREYSKDRQIIISTHSPYFVDLHAIKNGGKIVRVTSQNETTNIFQLSDEATQSLVCLAFGNNYNPHIFGTDAKEIFFLEDKIILVEGQEDVVLFPTIAEQLNLQINGNFFGWGASGADNVDKICDLFKCLGFEKVVVIFDADKKYKIGNLEKKFSTYKFYSIPADDIRYKKEIKAKAEKFGLLDSSDNILSIHQEATSELINLINNYFY